MNTKSVTKKTESTTELSEDYIQKKLEELHSIRHGLDEQIYQIERKLNDEQQRRKKEQWEAQNKEGIEFCKSLLNKYAVLGDKLIKHEYWAPGGDVVHDYDYVDVYYIKEFIFSTPYDITFSGYELYARNGNKYIKSFTIDGSYAWFSGKHTPRQDENYCGGFRIISGTELSQAIDFFNSVNYTQDIDTWILHNDEKPFYSIKHEESVNEYSDEDFGKYTDMYLKAEDDYKKAIQPIPPDYLKLIESQMSKMH